MHFKEFEHCYNIFSQFDFSEDGRVSFEDETPGSLFAKVDAMFGAVVIYGKRTVDYSQHVMKKYTSQDKWKEWRKVQTSIYNSSIDYIFCYNVRNVLEHDYELISLVNVDEDAKRAGFAINLDNGILDTETFAKKKDVRRRLIEFARERVNEGLVPWLSVGEIVKQYVKQLSLLHMLCVYYLIEEVEDIQSEYKVALNRVPEGRNCVIRHMSNDAQVGSSCRVYSILPCDYLSAVKRDVESFFSNMCQELENDGFK